MADSTIGNLPLEASPLATHLIELEEPVGPTSSHATLSSLGPAISGVDHATTTHLAWDVSGHTGSGGTIGAGSIAAFQPGVGAAEIVQPSAADQVLLVNSTPNDILFGQVKTAGIADAAVTLAKIANASANSKLVGSGSAGSGAAYSEVTLGTGLTMTGTTLSASGGVALGDTPTWTGVHTWTHSAATVKIDSGGVYAADAVGFIFTTTTNTWMRISSGYILTSVTGNSVSAFNSTGLMRLVSGGCFAFASGNPDATGADIGLSRGAANVFYVGSGAAASTAGWITDAGVKRVTADVPNSTGTMANLTDLTMTLLAGRKYVGYLLVFASNSTAAEGIQFDFDGGAATATSFVAGLAGTPIGTTAGVVYSTAIATDLTVTVATTGDIAYMIAIEIVVNAGGTFIPRFSEVSHTTGTATVRLGSHLILTDCPV